MSNTTILRITKDDIYYEEELGNSHGFASLIWTVLCKKHFGLRSWVYLSEGEGIKMLWDLAKDTSIPVCDRVCLYLTFDGAYVERDKLEWAADHIDSFLDVNAIDEKYVNHLPEVAKLYRLYYAESGDDLVGIGIHQTSCGDSSYHKYEEVKFLDDAGVEHSEQEKVPDWDRIYGIYDKFTSV